MKNACVIVGLVILGWASVAWTETAEVTEKIYAISQYLIEVEGGDDEPVKVRGSENLFYPERWTFTSLSGDQRLVVGALTLSLGSSGEILGNGTPDFQPEDGFRLISAPRIIVPDGKEGIMRSGMVSRLQYMVRQKDGDFCLKSVDSETVVGMKMTVLLSSPENAEFPEEEVDLQYSVKTTFMAGRERLPGVELDVGKPIIETREAETRLRVPLDTWMLLHSISGIDRSDGAATRLIVMMRIVEKTP